jgi:hypothetical protein
MKRGSTKSQASTARKKPGRCPGWSLVHGIFPALRRDVWLELALEQGDLVFQEELAFLEALQLQLILRGGLGEAGNDVIEVSVFGVQLMDPGPETFDVGGMYHGVISSIPSRQCSSV